MYKRTVIVATEQEVLDVLKDTFPEQEWDSIVAYEELGNQEWCVEVRPEDLTGIQGNPMFRVREFLNHACFLGKLEPGFYEVDCTW